MKIRAGWNLVFCSLSLGILAAGADVRADQKIAVAKLSPSLKYSMNSQSEEIDQADTQTFVAALTLRLQDSGLLPVKYERDDGPESTFLTGLDAIYFDDSLKHSAFLKMGVAVSDSKVVGELLSFKDGYIYHQKTKGGMPFALYLRGFSKTEATHVIETAQLATLDSFQDHSKLATVIDWIIPSAIAGSAVPCKPGEQVSVPGKSALNALSKIGDAAYNNKITGCVIGAGKAIKAMIPGVGTAWSSLKKNGISGSAEKIWGAVKKSTDNLVAWNMPIRSQLSQMSFEGGKKFEQLSPEMQGELACEVWLNLDGAALTAGIGAVGSALAIQKAISKVSKMTKFAKEIDGAADASKAVALTDDSAKAVTSAITEHPELKQALKDAGVAEHEHDQVLKAVAGAATGKELSSHDEFVLTEAMKKMSPEQARKFEATAQKVAAQRNPASREALPALFLREERIVEIEKNGKLYPELTKLQVDGELKTPEDVEGVAAAIVDVEKSGVPQAKIEKTLEEAAPLCKK